MSTFRTIAVVSFPAEAQVIKSKLESEQVCVFLKDEFTVATDPFASTALGGVKLQVYKEDYIKAMALIEKYAPELIDKTANQYQCPSCMQRDVTDTYDISTAVGLYAILKAVFLNLFSFLSIKRYACNHCHHKF